MEIPVLALVVAPFAVFLVLLGLAGWASHRRHQVLLAWAHGVGWRLVGSDPSLAHRWRGQPFGTGHARRVTELLAGTFSGRPAISFRYTYETGSGKNRSTITHHVLALALPAYLPTVELTPDGLGAKLAKAFGGQDIQFESEDFNRTWRVTARDDRFAHSFVHPRLIERLLQPDARGLSLRVEGTDLLCWSVGAPQLDTVGPRLQVMSAVVDHVPRFVWLDHGHDPSAAAPAAPPSPSSPPSSPGSPPGTDPFRPGGPSWKRFSS